MDPFPYCLELFLFHFKVVILYNRFRGNKRSLNAIGRVLMSAFGCFRIKLHYNKENSRNEMQVFEDTTIWSNQIEGLGYELGVSRYSYHAKNSFGKSAI